MFCTSVSSFFFIHCAAAPADVHSRSDGALATETVKDFITTYAIIKMQDSDEKKPQWNRNEQLA